MLTTRPVLPASLRGRRRCWQVQRCGQCTSSAGSGGSNCAAFLLFQARAAPPPHGSPRGLWRVKSQTHGVGQGISRCVYVPAPFTPALAGPCGGQDEAFKVRRLARCGPQLLVQTGNPCPGVRSPTRTAEAASSALTCGLFVFNLLKKSNVIAF